MRFRRNGLHGQIKSYRCDRCEAERDELRRQRVAQQHAEEKQTASFRIKIVVPNLVRPNPAVLYDRLVVIEIMRVVVVSASRIETFEQQQQATGEGDCGSAQTFLPRQASPASPPLLSSIASIRIRQRHRG